MASKAQNCNRRSVGRDEQVKQWVCGQGLFVVR
jgi:hypothetical protein